jgi:F-type H+-transporting ATPase subunit a
MAKVKQFMFGTPRRTAWTIILIVLFLMNFLPFMKAPPPHVVLTGEQVFPNSPWWLTNSVITTLVVDVILIVLALITRFSLREVPSGLANVMEAIVETLYNLAESVAGKNAGRFFPWVATIFLLVILSNWSGLIPGVGSIGVYYPADSHGEEEHEEQAPAEGSESQGFRWEGQLTLSNGNLLIAAPGAVQAAPVAAEEGEEKFVPLFRAPSADLNFTFALALSTMVTVQVWGVRFLGGSYFRKFFTFSGPSLFMKFINAFVGILELISEFARIISFGFRLFGNIFAGEVVLLTIIFLLAFLVPVPFYLLETFVGFVQALVFMMLALVFFQMATISHGSHDEHH